MGNHGWSYDDVAPVFHRMECTDHGDEKVRGRSGLLKVSESNDQSPLYDALFAAGEEIELPRNPDYSDGNQEGMVKTQVTIHGGLRMSTARCYLDPAKSRPNLTVETRAFAQRVVVENGECKGVEYVRGGRTHRALAGTETILSCGSINSPQLLELLGIGRPEVLQRQGIDVVHELSGVGEHLIDHAAPRMLFSITGKRVTYNDRSRGLGLAWEVLRYAFRRTGFLSIPSAPVLAFFRSREGLTEPDSQIHFVPFQVANLTKREIARTPGITLTIYQLRPESRGSVHIKSDRADVNPRTCFNFFDAKTDRRVMIDAVRFARRLMSASALDALRGGETQPGDAAQTDDEILDWIREKSETVFYPVGTCRMGSDPLSVVDSRLRVHGIDKLRVADGSIMPTLISGNTNAACIMIGEKAAEMVLRDHA
jgi:choline dehydrogenase